MQKNNLPAMVSGTENVINRRVNGVSYKKKQKRKGNSLPSSLQPVPENLDEFDELNWCLRKPRLSRKDCPNPILWWGVSNKIHYHG